MRNIIFVAGLHGDEQMPVEALKKNRIRFVLGNARAKKKGVRFIDRDLNASFGVRATGYEAQRAREVLGKIKNRDLVVDFHTTTAKTPPFVIVVDKKMLSFAATTGIKRVVVMRHNIKNGHALIDHRDGISVEVGNHGTQKSFDMTLRVVRNVLSGRRFPVEIYEVYDRLVMPGKYHNFQKHPDGFIPILAGERAYDFYGLKARRRRPV